MSRHLHAHLTFEDVAFISSAHPQGIPEADLTPGLLPLSNEELHGKFKWEPPWDVCPRGDPSSEDLPTAQTWIVVSMSGDVIGSLGPGARAGSLRHIQSIMFCPRLWTRRERLWSACGFELSSTASIDTSP